jgi:hypothetical protein
MAKILAKIARRNNGNELPKRNELVETELFDTDRNPWSPEGGGGDEFWERHDYDLACPYYPPWDPDGYSFGKEVLGPINLVVERIFVCRRVRWRYFRRSNESRGRFCDNGNRSPMQSPSWCGLEHSGQRGRFSELRVDR